MKTAAYRINNTLGLHARPAADIARFAGKHKSEVTLECGEKKANGKSVLMIIALGAKKGTEVKVTVSGEDEEEVFEGLEEMFHHSFYEE